jgi:hypothetical protein
VEPRVAEPGVQDPVVVAVPKLARGPQERVVLRAVADDVVVPPVAVLFLDLLALDRIDRRMARFFLRARSVSSSRIIPPCT